MHLRRPAGVAKINNTGRSLMQLRLLYDLNKYGDDTFAITGAEPFIPGSLFTIN